MPIPFEVFMQQALHDPQHGYYARHIGGVGARGDFTTAPMLSDHLACAIARWASQALRDTGCKHLIEVGPGTGELSRQILKYLPLIRRWTTTLHLVENSPRLTQIQQQTLGRRARWHSDIHSAINACQGHAVIFSNELVDAFPVRRFRKTPHGWQEIAVHLSSDQPITESLLDPAPLPDSTIFQREFAEGQCVEVHDSYHRWLKSWMPQWQAGRLLTIDYGAESQNLYPRQPHGSIRAYLLQQRLTGPAIYQNIGRQDLTADVNFSDLITWSQPWTRTSQLCNLATFLGPSAPAGLIDPDGAGTAFHVLEQQVNKAES